MIHLLLPTLKKGGVYDFALRLQEAIGKETIGKETMILVHVSKENIVDWKVGPDDTVILQMSGYGFAKRGAPLWLLRELEMRRKDIKTLGFFFHELYAFGPPWTSSFWLSPVQRHIARRLVVLSDFWMTNREGSAYWLRRFAADKPHAVLPVFSTIGEPVEQSEIRLPRVIVFGSVGLRQKTYEAAGEELFAWAKREFLEIHDIGLPITDMQLAETLRAKGVIQHGRLDEREVGRLMEDAMFGILAYPVHVLTKSSVFAAYCAHGVNSILISDDYKTTDGLVSGKHYLPGIPSDFDTDFMALSHGYVAWLWYQEHNLAIHAKTLLKFRS